jgi:hypothetical protein
MPVFSHGQTDEASLREKVLSDITKESETKSKELEEKIIFLDRKIKDIDATLSKPNTDEGIIDKLKERVRTLEEKEDAQKKKELAVYQANYQTAVINLVSMEREIKPLELFFASQEFYSQLNQISNPMEYPDFSRWYAEFKTYLETNRRSDAVLDVTSRLLTTAGDFSRGFGITGALSESLFLSMGKFVESFSGKNKKDLRDKSLRMFQLTMTLSQYTTDKNFIENDWDDINKQLEELKSLQESTLNETLKYIGIARSDFESNFIAETNAIKTLDYLNKVKNLAGEKVMLERGSNGDGWKDKIYVDMQTVQSLKIRFGQTTTRLHSNIRKYDDLVKKYKNDEFLGARVYGLETKLIKLSDTFDKTFNPQKYISDAVKMYKIY